MKTDSKPKKSKNETDVDPRVAIHNAFSENKPATNLRLKIERILKK